MNGRRLSALIMLILVLLNSFVIYQKLEQKDNIIRELIKGSNEQQKLIVGLKNNLTDLESELNAS